MGFLSKVFGKKKIKEKKQEPKQLFDSKIALEEENKFFSSMNCSGDNCGLMVNVLKKSTEFFVKSDRMPESGVAEHDEEKNNK